MSGAATGQGSDTGSLVAVVPVRDGVLPSGAAEAIVEAGGDALLVGQRVDEAAAEIIGLAQRLVLWEAGPFAPARWSAALAEELRRRRRTVILPGSPDGRDLAPRLAASLGWPLVAGAVAVGPRRATTTALGDRCNEDYASSGPMVTTLVPGCRSVPEPRTTGLVTPQRRDITEQLAALDSAADPEVVSVAPPDPTAMDLTEATRIVAGGAGLNAAEEFELLATVGTALGAAMGATRVVTDAGWVDHQRQIGTTGVCVHPRTYLAFGISGAVQHTGGIGHPEHVVSVNLDPSCPMMTMADLAIVADASAVLRRLAIRLGLAGEPPSASGAVRSPSEEHHA